MERHILSGGRYPVLRAMALLYLIGAGVAIVAGVVGCIWVLFRAPVGTWGDRLLLCASAMAASFFLCIGSLAVAEVLKLFMDIEHNTRGGMMATPPATVAAPAGEAVGAATGAPAAEAAMGHRSRFAAMLDEETAEGALLRGH